MTTNFPLFRLPISKLDLAALTTAIPRYIKSEVASISDSQIVHRLNTSIDQLTIQGHDIDRLVSYFSNSQEQLQTTMTHLRSSHRTLVNCEQSGEYDQGTIDMTRAMIVLELLAIHRRLFLLYKQAEDEGEAYERDTGKV